MAPISDNVSSVEQDSEDEFDWEEVEVPEHQEQETHLEITISSGESSRSKKNAVGNKSKGIPHTERLQRINCHKIHTVVLLGNAWIRNRWLNDELLQARLLSVTPLSLQDAFAMIHKSRVPDQNQRGRLFEQAVTNLVEWWSLTYFEVTQEGHIRNRTYEDVRAKLAKLDPPPTDPDTVLDIEDIEDLLRYEPERIRNAQSLMKHVLMQNGSRDVSAQLFTALCRALGVPARLVVSLQSVPWQVNVGKPRPAYNRKPKDDKGKKKENVSEDGGMEGDLESNAQPSTSRSGSETPLRKLFPGEGERLDGASVSKSAKAKGKEKAAPIITLRKTKSKGRVLGNNSTPSPGPSKLASPDPTTTPPVFWTEVFSRPDGRWIPVDPIRCIVNKRKVFDPTPTTNNAQVQAVNSPLFPPAYAAALNRRAAGSGLSPGRFFRQENRMVYVLAFEEDGFARDVTRRYAREFGAKIAKVQGGSSTIGGGVARLAWWETIVCLISRPYRLHRDDIEDEELEAAQLMEGMPGTMAGFKDHPLYVLARHLKQNQVIHPPDTPEIGKFRGEPVYPRSTVVSLKTAENWMRSEGRMVIGGTQPLKMIKIRSGTINRMRELEVMKEELKDAGSLGDDIMQGLYARSQTEPYKPDPVVGGKVPKNNFGNIDLYVPSMLPHGGVHVPFKGVAKIAKKLGFDFAEAVVGFEFKKRRAFPVLEGVVVAQENEAALLEAYWEAEQDAEEKARLKREERVLKLWTRLVQGLRIRQRLQAQYATKPDKEQHSQDDTSNTNDDGQPGSPKDIVVTMSHPNPTVGSGGGFLVTADEVVQPFHLPKYKYQVPVDSVASPSGDDASNLHDLMPDMSIKIGSGSSEAALEPNGASANGDHADIAPEMEPEEASICQKQLVDPAEGQDGHDDYTKFRGIPKTMQELAAEETDGNNATAADDDGDDVGTFDSNTNWPMNNREADDPGTSKIKTAPRPIRVKRGQANGKAAVQRASSNSIRRASSRIASKKRPRDENTEDEMDSYNENADTRPTPSPKKRAMRSHRDRVTPTPSSTRTLRPRVSKTASQLWEDKEQEEAYQHAIGE